MTLTEADRQRMAEGGVSYGEESGVQLIAMMAGSHVNPVVTVRTTDYGRHISSRNTIVCFHPFSVKSNLLVVITCKTNRILNSVKIMTNGGMGPKSLSDISHYTPLLLSEVPQEKWDEECPGWLLYSTWSDNLTCHMMEQSEEHIHIHLGCKEPPGLLWRGHS